MPTVEDALSYARAGWPIFPLHTIVNGKCTCRNGSECHSPGKHPRNSHGHNEGTSDEAQITRWWKQWPNSNIGLWCKGLIVVDVDPRNGGDASLEDLFSTKADKYGFETLTALTGGGGHHYIFNAPDEKNYDCKPVPGIEIKSSGGLIVISPSIHISGRQYQWEDDSVPVVPAPKWILDMVTQPEKAVDRPAFTGKPLDLEAFIKKHNIPTKTPKVCRCKFGGYQWDLIGDCPFQPGYAGGNAAIGVTEAGATWFGCFCGDHPKKTWADFKDLYVTKKEKKTVKQAVKVATPELPQGEYVPGFEESAEDDINIDLEVQDAINRNDPKAIWNMIETLAAMPEIEYQINRMAIKQHFKFTINTTALDAEVKKRRPDDEPSEEEEDFSFKRSNEPWEKKLHRKADGGVKPVLVNADAVLRHHPDWKGVLAFDEFKQKIMIVSNPPIIGGFNRAWTDEDDTRTAVWMQSNGVYVGTDIVGAAVYAIARENQFHPVRNYLNSLKWDGTPRIDSWLKTYMGVFEDQYLTSVTGRKWLISAVARIMQPGCKVDHMLVLEGSQGLKKSTALSILAGTEFFCDNMPDISTKDASMQMCGSWIIEWAELDAMRRAETTATKAFLSRQVEKIRPPYGKNTIEFPRQCVFAGTTNRTDYLCDDTGNRRYWPAACTFIDINALRRDRDQIWAEAKFAYDEGETWWLDTKDQIAHVAEAQKRRVEADAWEDIVVKYVDDHLFQKSFSPEELLSDAIKLDVTRQTQVERRRVCRILREHGLVRKTVRDESGTSKKFCRVEE